MTKDLNQWSRSELLALPRRAWNDESGRFRSIIILNTRKKHDSGFGMVTIIGCDDDGQPCQILTMCSDDVEWITPESPVLSYPTESARPWRYGHVRTDCLFRSGAMRFWLSRSHYFGVGCALSSIRVEVVPHEPA